MYVWTQKILSPELGMVIQHHKPECLAEKLVHFVQCQGHSEGLYGQNMNICLDYNALVVTLTLKIVNKLFLMTHRLMIIHHHTKCAKKKIF